MILRLLVVYFATILFIFSFFPSKPSLASANESVAVIPGEKSNIIIVAPAQMAPEKKDQRPNPWPSQEATAFLSLVVSLFSFITVILLFVRQQKDRREDRMMNVDSYWYQEFFMTPKKDEVLGFFESLVTLIDNHVQLIQTNQLTPTSLQELHFAIKAAIGGLIDSVADELVIIAQNVSEELTNILLKLEDDLGNEIQKASASKQSKDWKPARECIASSKRVFLKALYDGHHETLNRRKPN